MALLLVALAPTTHASMSKPTEIIVCDGASSRYCDIDTGSGGDFSIGNWGSSTMSCYGSHIRGLRQVRSFTFWVRTGSYTGTPMATGSVFGPNGALASVNIMDLLPTTASSSYQAMTADFGSLVALNTSQT
jgi:hypothetical protein